MFAACALRRGYVAGTEQFRVSYLEGVLFSSAFRRRGTAAGLLRYRKTWAKGKGCAEFAATANWKTGRASGLCRVRPLGL